MSIAHKYIALDKITAFTISTSKYIVRDTNRDNNIRQDLSNGGRLGKNDVYQPHMAQPQIIDISGLPKASWITRMSKRNSLSHFGARNPEGRHDII